MMIEPGGAFGFQWAIVLIVIERRFVATAANRLSNRESQSGCRQKTR